MSKDQDPEPDEPYYITDGFPIEESFACWDGSQRTFIITCQYFPEHGYVVEAREKTNPQMGYAFAAHDANYRYGALGKLRKKMQKALVIRHIHQVFDQYAPIHDTITGRITSSNIFGGPVFIVDGIELSIQDLLGMMDMHEGWQFKLQFVDLSEEVGE